MRHRRRGTQGDRPPPSDPGERRALPFHRPGASRAARAEIEHHLAERTEQLVARGWDPDEARTEAERRFGDPARYRRRLEDDMRREARRKTMIGWTRTLMQDVAYALRRLRRAPVFGATVVLTVGLGIGVNLSLYRLVDAVLLSPLPVERPDELVALRWDFGSETSGGVSYPDFGRLRGAAGGLTSLAAFATTEVGVQVADRTERVSATAVSGDYFDMLGVVPRAGRLLEGADAAMPSGRAVAVVGHGLWSRMLDGSAGAVGRVVDVGGTPFTVVGVAPEGFSGTSLSSPAALWIPLPRIGDVVPEGSIYGGPQAWENEHFPWLSVVGRLAPGAGVQRVAAELTAAAARTEESGREPASVALVPVERAAVGQGREGLLDLLVFVGTVVGTTLLLACVNVAGLLLARGTARVREMAIRRSIGASRARLVRQLLTEAVVLGVVAGLLAPAVAALTNRLLVSFTLPGSVALGSLDLAPGAGDVTLAALVAVACAAGAGLLPAFRASRGRPTGGGRGREGGLLRVLLAGQVALSVVLVVAAGLFARSVRQGLAVDTGLRAEGITAISFGLSAHGYAHTEAGAFSERLLTRLSEDRRVLQAATAAHVPLAPSRMAFRLVPEDDPEGEHAPIAVNSVQGDYFEMMGIELLDGRAFGPGDLSDAEKVAVLSRDAARALWPDADPLGRRFMLMRGLPPIRVVGIVEDVVAHGVDEGPEPYAYLPTSQFAGVAFDAEGTALVRTRPGVDPGALLREELRALDPSLPLYGLRRVDEQIRNVLAPRRFGARLAGLLALVALLVSAVGIHGAVSYTVSRRRRDIGIRVALGARPRRIVGEVVGKEGLAVASGLGVGLGLAAWGSRLIEALLFGVRPVDPSTFGAAAGALTLVALVAASRPTRRALSVDPRETLQEEG